MLARNMFFAILLVSGCGSDGSSSELEGVYTLETWTDNDTGCAAEGPSILESQTETAFYLEFQSFLGFTALVFNDCVDVAACAAEAASDDFVLSGLSFDEGSDSDGWSGGSYILNSGGDGPCDGLVFIHSMTAENPEATQVRIVTETKNVEGIPRDAEGFCDGEAAIAEGRNQACVELEVRTGLLAQPL